MLSGGQAHRTGIQNLQKEQIFLHSGRGPDAAPLHGAHVRPSVTGAISPSVSVIAWHNFDQVKSRKMLVLVITRALQQRDPVPFVPVSHGAPANPLLSGQRSKKDPTFNHLGVSQLHVPVLKD